MAVARVDAGLPVRPLGGRHWSSPRPAQPPGPSAGLPDGGDPSDCGEVLPTTDVVVDGVRWGRRLIRTHVIRPGEDPVATVERYVRPHVRPGDWVFVGQKALSIAQGRLVRERAVRPRPLAVLLSRYVRRTPFGRGLGRPATMEVALREAGVPRILLAAAVHMLGRPFGRSGDFYRVAGRRVAAIDGVTEWALPPYNEYIVLHPREGGGFSKRLASRLRTPVAVVDLNHRGAADPTSPKRWDPAAPARCARRRCRCAFPWGLWIAVAAAWFVTV